MIDTTLYNAQRQAWPALPGMVAAPVQRGTGAVVRWDLRLPLFCALRLADGDYALEATWLDNDANNGWASAPDAARERRTGVIAALQT
jgi:hypothetical protein